MAGLLSFIEDSEPAELEKSLKWRQKVPSLKSEKKTPQEKSSADNGQEIVSLNFDQVNDNADELVELRGEGRYFGVTDPDTGDSINAQQSRGRICDNCHKPGHVRSKCKAVICHKCGVEGDHYESHCPTTVVCGRCGERGHVAGSCQSKHVVRRYCKNCDSNYHSEMECPSIWRSYLTVQVNKGKKLPVAYCYNCGESSHYGDECPAPRSSRLPNGSGSAFSGSNLPQALRDSYYGKVYGASSRNYSHNSWDTNSHFNNSEAKKPKGQNYRKANKGATGSSNANGNSSGANASSKDMVSKKKNNPGFNSLQASRSGMLPKNRNVPMKPSRSGVIQDRKKGANFQKYY